MTGGHQIERDRINLPTEKMTATQHAKSQQTRDELLKVALALFNQKGYAATTIASITKSAGYAKGTFYRYWKSKDELFLGIMKKRLMDYRAAREDGLRRAQTIEDVMVVLIDFLESMIDDENWSKVFLEFTIHASGSDSLKQELNTSKYRLSADLFAQIIDPYKTTQFPSNKMGALVTALFEGYIIQSLLGTNVIDKEDLRQAILIIALSTGKESSA